LQKRFAFLRTSPMPPSWREGTNGDLWRLVQRTDIVITWMRAHLTPASCIDLGFRLPDWAGNRAADFACGEVARDLLPDGASLARRALQLDALETVQAVTSAVEMAVLAKHHAPSHPIAKRRLRRRRSSLRFLPKKRKPPLKPAPPRCPEVGRVQVPGVHTLALAYGPFPAQEDPCRVGWPIHCIACSASVSGVGRWSAFATALCLSDPSAVHLARGFEPHALFRCLHGWFCSRCRLPVTSSRRAAAARARCPVPAAVNGAGAPATDTVNGYSANLALVGAWRSLLSGGSLPPLQMAIAPPPAPGPLALRWRAHWRLQGGGNSSILGLCILCGAGDTRRAPRLLAGTACIAGPPVPALFGNKRAALLAGVFDHALQARPLAWRVRAVRLGWLPLGDR
jgi:hypothetical protein